MLRDEDLLDQQRLIKIAAPQQASRNADNPFRNVGQLQVREQHLEAYMGRI